MSEQGTTKDLLPCPFCGGTNLKVFVNAVQCMDVACSAAGPDLGHCMDEPEAIMRWNKRAAQPPEAGYDANGSPVTE
jgi:Lar family restriction alleviation protein